MKRSLLLIVLAVPLSIGSVLANSYTIDPGHTYVSFAVNHLGFSTMRGKFNRQSGTLNYDPLTKTAAISIHIVADSIDTGHVKRDQHLRSPDFLNAVENPIITFKSTQVNWQNNKPSSVIGNVTIMGIEKPVTLKILAMHCGQHPFNKKQICGFDAEGSIKRSDFGINYGIPAIGDVIDLNIELEAVKN